MHDKIKQQEFIIDYNWYQIEITEEGEIIRGSLTELDPSGVLIIRNVINEKKSEDLPEPVIRGLSGREIPQDNSVFAKPNIRKRGAPVKKSEFINFIRTLIKAKEDKR